MRDVALPKETVQFGRVELGLTFQVAFRDGVTPPGQEFVEPAVFEAADSVTLARVDCSTSFCGSAALGSVGDVGSGRVSLRLASSAPNTARPPNSGVAFAPVGEVFASGARVAAYGLPRVVFPVIARLWQ